MREMAANDVAALMAMSDAVQLAKAEGRYKDDVSATAENIVARLGKGKWYLTGAEVSCLFGLAQQWDQDDAAARTAAGTEKTAATIESWNNIAIRVVGAMNAMGAVAAADMSLGWVAAEVIPRWVPYSTQATNIHEPSAAVSASQANRWKAWETAHRELLLATRQGNPWPPFNPGCKWLPWPGTGQKPSYAYDAEATKALRESGSRFWQLKQQAEAVALEAAREEFRVKTGGVEARQDASQFLNISGL
jgi:hypothetical protein